MKDIKKLEKEKPEMFDEQNITDLNVDGKYQAAMDNLRPNWAKELVAKRKSKA